MKRRWIGALFALLVTAVIGCGPAVAEHPDTEEESVPVRTESVAESNEPESVEPEEVQAGLKDLFAEHGMKVGTCLTTQMTSTAKWRDMVLQEFNSVTMENHMKPDYIFDKKASIAQGDLVVSFNKDMTKMLEFAKNNDMAVRGHTFVWYSQTPKWIFHEDFNLKKPYVNRDVMLQRMESYIRQMFEKLDEAGYLDLFYAYDVVNEAWMEDGKQRTENNPWYDVVGEDYLYYAFYYADKYAPEHVDLYYNDYNEQYKADCLVEFVETLKDENGEYLIDGIGLQAHLYTQDDLDQYFKAVDKLSETGLKIQVTELDVSLGAWQNEKPANDENLKAQGRYYYNLVKGLFDRVDAGTLKMDSLTFWGLSDKMSWRSSASPLLFDTKGNPKYAYYGAMQQKEKAGFNQ